MKEGKMTKKTVQDWLEDCEANIILVNERVDSHIKKLSDLDSSYLGHAVEVIQVIEQDKHRLFGERSVLRSWLSNY